MQVAAGEFLAVAGSSSCGKTGEIGHLTAGLKDGRATVCVR